ncbi:alpha/beta hydrolase [Paraburkholderia nodosa]|uniref:alpha/beta hydrolase n=1 Tax=Paraburkholderia nodosa TaxID=392320 RepID=UPI0004814875|nr:alpha/beta hydrolase [Paraburkholderia nodosa]
MQVAPFDPLRLAPDVRELLAAMAASGAPPLESLPLAQRREAYRQIGATLGGEPVPVREVRALLADGPAGKIPLRLYLPDKADGVPYGVTVYLHGGGWTLGDLDSHDRICRRLVRASGCGVVSVDYRLAPEHPAPAGPEDVLAAIRWLASHAVSLGLDPERIAVAGDSAGGSLAAVACQRLRGEVPLRAQVLFYPSTDLSPAGAHFASRYENGAVPPLTLELMHVMSAPFSGSFDTNDTRLSPLLEPDLSNLPQALIITAECDVLRDDGSFYCNALQAAGVPAEYVEVQGMVHGFIEMAGVLPAAVEAIERAGAHLREILA